MKRLILLAVFLGAFSTLFSQTHNDPVDESAQMSAKVIRPFSVENYDDIDLFNLPDVIKGDKRDLEEPVYKVFSIGKESGYKVHFTLTLPNSIEGVILNAQWVMWDTPPDTDWGPFPPTVLNWLYGWDWGENATELLKTDGWIGVKVNSIDAINAEDTGVVSFIATCSGSYVGL